VQRTAVAERESDRSVPPIVNDVLRSAGEPLDAPTRSFFEQRFGHDFSKVRVHTDSRAAESAEAVNALAYTVGRDIVFAAGEYEVQNSAGKRLMAHELAHTLQQGQSQTNLELSVPGDAHEREADVVSEAILDGRQTPVISANSASAVQRVVSEKDEIAWETRNPDGKVEYIKEDDRDSIVLWNFAVGSAALKSAHEAELRGVAKKFSNASDQFVLDIEGHTSGTGSPTRNERISKARALEVKAFLAAEGVFRKQMLTSGAGAARPWVGETSPENLAKNRRVILRASKIA
jgi:outer membrane protein OmpA-like peptidoglycan-associated protein